MNASTVSRLKTPLLTLALTAMLPLSACGLLEEELVPMENPNPIDAIRGTVDEVRYRENKAEDGHFSVVVKNGEKRYLIEATAYMNTPKQPEDDNMDCLLFEPGDVNKGDQVAFVLPPAVEMTFPPGETYSAVFQTCHPVRDATEYFISTSVPSAGGGDILTPDIPEQAE